jgi:hypothetical protein
MTENISAVLHAETKNTLSEQEKRNYYRAWENSGMPKSDFCKKNHLPVNSLYYWHKLFKKESSSKNGRFSPVVTKITPPDHQQTVIQIEMRLPNQVQLSIPLNKSNLASFIQELCNAVTIIR